VGIDEPAGRLERLLGWHAGIDQPHPRRRRRHHVLARRRELHRGAGTDQPRQPHRAAPAGQQAELDLGKAEERVLGIGGHPEVAGQGQLQTAAEADAVDDRHRGPGQPRQPGEERSARVAQPGDLRLGQAANLVEPRHVGTGEEGSGARGAEQEAPRPAPCRAVLEVVEGGGQVGQHARREHVLAVVVNRKRERHEAVVGVLDRECGGLGRCRGHDGDFSGFACPGLENR